MARCVPRHGLRTGRSGQEREGYRPTFGDGKRIPPPRARPGGRPVLQHLRRPVVRLATDAVLGFLAGLDGGRHVVGGLRLRVAELLALVRRGIRRCSELDVLSERAQSRSCRPPSSSAASLGRDRLTADWRLARCWSAAGGIAATIGRGVGRTGFGAAPPPRHRAAFMSRPVAIDQCATSACIASWNVGLATVPGVNSAGPRPRC